MHPSDLRITSIRLQPRESYGESYYLVHFTDMSGEHDPLGNPTALVAVLFQNPPKQEWSSLVNRRTAVFKQADPSGEPSPSLQPVASAPYDAALRRAIDATRLAPGFTFTGRYGDEPW